MQERRRKGVGVKAASCAHMISSCIYSLKKKITSRSEVLYSTEEQTFPRWEGLELYVEMYKIHYKVSVFLHWPFRSHTTMQWLYSCLKQEKISGRGLHFQI